MTNNIEDSPFIKMRKQFLKEKDDIVARYEAEILALKKRVDELESRDVDNIVDVSPDDLEKVVDINKPFFDAGEDNDS